MYHIPPPDEIEPVFNAATESAVDTDSPVSELPDIEMIFSMPEPRYNEATLDAAKPLEEDENQKPPD